MAGLIADIDEVFYYAHLIADCGDAMQRHSENVHDGEAGLLTSDASRLVRIVAMWAAARPILQDSVLFGERLKPGRRGLSPVEIWVAYDHHRLEDGFDDWIEQLRTRFVGLSELLDEPVSVLTPDCPEHAAALKANVELPAYSNGKARLAVPRSVIEPAASVPASPAKTVGSWTERVLLSWVLPLNGSEVFTSKPRP